MWNADHRCVPVISPTSKRFVPDLSQLWFAGVFGFGLAMSLGGCSTPDVPKPLPAPKAPAVDTKPQAHALLPKPKPKQELASETHVPPPPPKVASVDPNSLIGLDPPSVEKMLGTPSSIYRGDPSLIWTYEGTGCAFKIVFYPDIKTAIFHALKFLMTDSSGGSSDGSQLCIRNILTVRNNGPA